MDRPVTSRARPDIVREPPRIYDEPFVGQPQIPTYLPTARGGNMLFLVNRLHLGGSERKTVRLANALANQGQGVTLAYLNEPETLRAELDPKVTAVHLHRTGKFSLRALRGLSGTIERSRIDTVVCVNLYPALYAALLARFSRRAAGVRFVASINTTEFRSARAQRRMLVYRPAIYSMDLLIFGAQYQRDLWHRRYLGRNPPRSAVLYNGIDVEHFRKDRIAAWRPPLWPATRVVIGAVGRLRPEKSHDHLIRAVAELHRRGCDVGAVIVGDGEQERPLRRMAVELALEDRVHLTGPARDVRPYLAGFDIFAITSSAVETFSNATLEAFAMSCPVVASRVGGMPEMLASGGGLMYEAGNVVELIEVLQGLVASERRRAALAEQGRASVVRRFSMEAMVESFRALLRTL